MRGTRLLATFGFALSSAYALAANYTIDTKGAHPAVNFKLKHLGYTFLSRTFKTLNGKLSWDPTAPAASKIEVVIDTTSLDSNHAQRDKHIRDERYLNVDEFPKARFMSTHIESHGGNKLAVHGEFTLHGVTKPITIDAQMIGEGADPWGGYRTGFQGTVTIDTKAFGMESFKPMHQVPGTRYLVEILLEGIRK
jgi:polyisoprenoid-binding protein YceI